ncbi:terpene synthase family protein [Actinomadura roseirufa]|uniref:terpene synthase family protein n=1 Tax=Actinomadura roseirufa TaxID=2094049 RepID=UPI0010417372|nr:terpene synthase family protein [Actinomadura roseirufa]
MPEGAVPEGGMLDVLAAADAAVVTARLTERSARWARRLGPPFDPGLAPLCSLPAAFVAPWLSPAGADLTVRTGLWIFALDAWTDGSAARRDPDRLRDGLARLGTIVRGTSPGGPAPLESALAELRDAVAVCPAVLPSWRRAVDEALAGALFEYEAALRVASGGAPPDLDEYLRQGAASVAFAPLVLAMWSDMSCPCPACGGAGGTGAARTVPAGTALTGTAPAGTAFACTGLACTGGPDAVRPGGVSPILGRALRDACLAVRLANDLRGHHREREEGVLDALALGLAPDEVRARISRHVARCRGALRPLLGPVPGPALALERQLLWSVRHYERTDAGHAA